MPTVLAILAEGFEEIELVSPIDLLCRVGATVTLAALGKGTHVTGRNGLTIHSDTLLASVREDSFECVFLPGWLSVKPLRVEPRGRGLILRHHQGGGWLAAIWAAPTALRGSFSWRHCAA
jgi:4-methyl-5(b-hydroxyethyl)-thiazole monophosphate biosynthesis